MIAQRRPGASLGTVEGHRARNLASTATPSWRGPASEAPDGARRTPRLGVLAAAVAGALVRLARWDLAATAAGHACCPRDTAGLESIRC
jgi:hypothetical protein